MVVTVSMNKTLPSPYYLFSFEHIASKDKVSFIGETIVSNTRYDKFRFNETTTTNLSLTPPNVNFNYLGQYYYSIYEQISSGNTNPFLSYNKLEEGRAVVVIGNAQTDDCWFEPYISDDEDFSNIIYISDQEEECQQPVISTFNIGTGFNSDSPFNIFVYDIQLQPDDKILVGGGFTNYNGEINNNLIRLNPNGSIDTTFDIGTGFNSRVNTILLQPDGKILVGGWFTSFNEETNNNYLIRLNSDGSKDTTFDIGTGFDNRVFALNLQPDGKILVGGQFTTFNGETNNRLIRLNADGSKDTTFDIGTGFNSFVFDIKLQPDGKILVGGALNTFTGQTNNRLIRLNSDGSKDTTFNIGSGFNNMVEILNLQPDGKILVGGQFTTFNGETNNNSLIRLNPDGSKDSTFNIGTGFLQTTSPIFTGTIYKINLQPDGKILAGGSFTTFNGETNNNSLIRLNPDGSKDSTFNIGTGGANVHALTLLFDDKVLIGGTFTIYNGQNVNRIIKLNSTGQSITIST